MKTIICGIVGGEYIEAPGMLQHRMGESAIEAITSGGKKVTLAAPLTPRQRYLESLYILNTDALLRTHKLNSIWDITDDMLHNETIFGFPASGIKAAMIRMCKLIDGIAMIDAKNAFFVNGINPSCRESLILELDNANYPSEDRCPQMRADIAKNKQGNAIPTYRGYFHRWKAKVRLRYNADIFSEAGILSLLSRAGSCGLGTWRPSSKDSDTGDFGRYDIDTTIKA